MRPLALLAAMLAAGCGIATDAATRLAFDLEAGARALGDADGATHRVQHETPSHPGQCTGPYTVQLDKVGALIVWCKDAAGTTISSHSTSYHSRFVSAPQTWKLDKPAGAPLTIELERRAGRAVVTDVH